MKKYTSLLLLPMLMLGACGGHAGSDKAITDTASNHITDTFKTDTASATNGPDGAPPNANDTMNIQNNGRTQAPYNENGKNIPNKNSDLQTSPVRANNNGSTLGKTPR